MLLLGRGACSLVVGHVGHLRVHLLWVLGLVEFFNVPVSPTMNMPIVFFKEISLVPRGFFLGGRGSVVAKVVRLGRRPSFK